jgi:putative ABC transport system ATP-binding protein
MVRRTTLRPHLPPPACAADALPIARRSHERGPILEARHICHSYGDGDAQVEALHDVSLSLHAGEFVLLMGPSGSGKSTLLSILSGLQRATSGEVRALGQSLNAMSAPQLEAFRLQHCGFIFSEYHLLPSLEARQQLEIVLRWAENVPAPEARRRADDILAKLGLAKKARLMPRQLSGGEQQRVAIARGLVKKPTFCFADEPTAALDWQRGRQVVELLQTAAHELGVCVLAAAHDERMIPHADRLLLLDEGRLQETRAGPIVASREP